MSGLISTISFWLRSRLRNENLIATVESLPLTGCSCTLGVPAFAATTATTLVTIAPAAATISSGTLATATLSAGEKNVLASRWFCRLDFGKPVPKDFL